MMESAGFGRMFMAGILKRGHLSRDVEEGGRERGGDLGEEAWSQDMQQVPKVSRQEQAWSVPGAAGRLCGLRRVS